jgi:hypothetical protein
LASPVFASGQIPYAKMTKSQKVVYLTQLIVSLEKQLNQILALQAKINVPVTPVVPPVAINVPSTPIALSPTPVVVPAPVIVQNPNPAPISATDPVVPPSLVITENANYISQTVAPNTVGAEIGSFILSNPSDATPLQVGTLNVGLVLGSFQGTRLVGVPIDDFSGIRISNVRGSLSLQPQLQNVFVSSDTLAPGQSEELDIYVNSSVDSGKNVTVQTTLNGVLGQTITFNQ